MSLWCHCFGLTSSITSIASNVERKGDSRGGNERGSNRKRKEKDDGDFSEDRDRLPFAFTFHSVIFTHTQPCPEYYWKQQWWRSHLTSSIPMLLIFYLFQCGMSKEVIHTDRTVVVRKYLYITWIAHVILSSTQMFVQQFEFDVNIECICP